MFRYRSVSLYQGIRRQFVRRTTAIMTQPQLETRLKCSFRCATFNILAPCYKNISDGSWWSKWESSAPEQYLKRYEAILEFISSQRLLHLICLQEFWFRRDVQDLFMSKLGSNYSRIELKRQGFKTDGLAIFVHRSLKVLAVHHLRFVNPGNRVGLLVHVGFPESGHEMVLMTTHLNYCHSKIDHYIKMSQIQAAVSAIDNFVKKNRIENIPVLLTGDFNSSQDDPVYGFVEENEFKSSYKQFHGQEPGVTHRDHHGQETSVDYIFYRNTMNRSLIVKSSSVLPLEYDCEDWPEEFTLSDHRMIVTDFELEERKS